MYVDSRIVDCPTIVFAIDCGEEAIRSMCHPSSFRHKEIIHYEHNLAVLYFVVSAPSEADKSTLKSTYLLTFRSPLVSLMLFVVHMKSNLMHYRQQLIKGVPPGAAASTTVSPLDGLHIFIASLNGLIYLTKTEHRVSFSPSFISLAFSPFWGVIDQSLSSVPIEVCIIISFSCMHFNCVSYSVRSTYSPSSSVDLSRHWPRQT